MKKINILVLFIFSFSNVVISQEYHIKGRVKDQANNQNLEFASILTIDNLGNKFYTLSDYLGNYELTIPMNRYYTITCALLTYVPIQQKINTLNKNEVITIHFSLILKGLELSNITTPIICGQLFSIDSVKMKPEYIQNKTFKIYNKLKYKPKIKQYEIITTTCFKLIDIDSTKYDPNFVPIEIDSLLTKNVFDLK